MTEVKLFVKLKIPDTTAITAFHTLERIGFKELKELEREDYYEFTIKGDAKKFSEKIFKVDLLVNANKHDARTDVDKESETVDVLVTDIEDDCLELLETLKKRLGFDNIEKVTKGVLWKMKIDSKEPKKVAEKITKELLCSEHYQKYCLM